MAGAARGQLHPNGTAWQGAWAHGSPYQRSAEQRASERGTMRDRAALFAPTARIAPTPRAVLAGAGTLFCEVGQSRAVFTSRYRLLYAPRIKPIAKGGATDVSKNYQAHKHHAAYCNAHRGRRARVRRQPQAQLSCASHCLISISDFLRTGECAV